MLLLHYPKCSTCKRAIRFLKENNQKFEERDIVKENPTEEELKKWIKMSKKDIKRFFNTSGIKYRELNLKENLNNMSDDEIIKLLASDGMLVKRPLLIMQNKILIGFKEDDWKNI